MAYGIRTTHHVKIGDYHYMVRPGSYRKQPAPQFGPRFTTGDPDYNNLSAWQHWAQTCWIGGFGQIEWADEAMWDEGAGVDSTMHDYMVLTRDLSRSTNAGGVVEIREFVEFNDILYLLCHGIAGSQVARLYKYANATETWSNIKTFASHARSAAVFGGKLFIGEGGAGIAYMNTDETFGSVAKPGDHDTDETIPGAMKVYKDRLYVGFEREIWRLEKTGAATFAWDGSTPFYTAEAASKRYCAMETHLGFLYIATLDGRIMRTDANNTYEMWDFDPGIIVQSLRSFDGRLFIGAVEPLFGTTARQGILYQFSGAAVTELKRWGKPSKDIFTGRMRIIGGRLYYGAPSLLGMGEGFGVALYDPVEDAHHMWATNKDYATYAGGTENINWLVDDVIYYRGKVHASVRGHGVFYASYQYRDVNRETARYDTTPDDSGPVPTNSGWYTSSDFDAGTPGLLKLWNAVTVYCDLPSVNTSVTVRVSKDGGSTWIDLGSVTRSTSQRRYHRIFFIHDGDATVNRDPLYGTSLKVRIGLHTTDTNYSPILKGVIVRYLPVPEPGWQWNMTLVLSEKQELLDGTVAEVGLNTSGHGTEPTIATKLAALREAFRAQSLIGLTEPDGTEWSAYNSRPGVIINQMSEHVHFIGPSSGGELEYEIPISLLEMHEHYDSHEHTGFA